MKRDFSGCGSLRSICVDRFCCNEDGTIREVVQRPSVVPAQK